MSELKISRYLKEYYHLKEDSVYETEYIDAKRLLVPGRFDLGAKLYYIQAVMENRNRTLAEVLYGEHILAFQDGIVQEAGNPEKSGMDRYFRTFDRLIEVFRSGSFDSEEEWIPVDQSGQILDGAHRTACAVYFNRKVKIVRLHSVKGRTFDYRFFRNRGLAKGYQEMMVAALVRYSDNIRMSYGAKKVMQNDIFYKGRILLICGQSESKERDQIEKVLNIQGKEQAGGIVISPGEVFRIKVIRFVRGKYTRLVLWMKKKLGMPV